MRWFSFHGGHSGEFCRHAKGRLEDVVEEAHQAGFTTYGLSEHAPRTRSGDLYPGEEDLTPAALYADLSILKLFDLVKIMNIFFHNYTFPVHLMNLQK